MTLARRVATQPELAEDQPWMPGWEHAPGDTVTIEMDTPTPGTDSVTTATYTTTTTYSAHMTSVVNGAGIPVVMTANANAASSTMLSAIGSTGAHGVMGTGSLGMITVMIMVYNLCVGLGLGVMLWKGKIDWKGNVNERDATATANVDNDDVVEQTIITATDIQGDDWHVPLTWIEAAAQHHIAELHATGSADRTVELTTADGQTGQIELDTLFDATTQTLRSGAAGLV